MSEFDAASFIEQATQSIQGERFDQALELANRALEIEPNNPDALMFKAIALSNLKQADEASATFRQVLAVNPTSAKAFFNFAVHSFKYGSKTEARELAEETLRLDSSHQGASELLRTIRNDEAAAAGVSQGGAVPPPPDGFNAPGPFRMSEAPTMPGFDPSGHALPWVRNLGQNWTLLGWFLTITSLLLVIFFWSTSGAEIIQTIQKTMADPEAARKAQEAGQTAGPQVPPLYSVLSYGNIALLLGWMIVDIIDRRGKWGWMAPFVLCCCCGLQGLVTGAYLLMGRKRLD